MSNFYRCNFVWRNRTWASTEHAFQAAKAQDEKDAETIRIASTPTEAKRLGNVVVRCPDWKEKRLGTMREIVAAKFAQNELLMRNLINT